MTEQKFKEFLRMLTNECLTQLFIYHTVYYITLDTHHCSLVDLFKSTKPRDGIDGKVINYNKWLSEVKKERGLL